MDEYGKVPRGPFLDVLGIKAGTTDGRFAVDFWADHVGYKQSALQLEVYEPGRQYFNIGWDQIPHLLSTSAKTLFGGVGLDPPDGRPPQREISCRASWVPPLIQVRHSATKH
jgi:hypothetical protein